jgi:hypothetical protein
MTTVEAVSFALGAASILLGLLAIWLSVHFYTRDQALFVETQRTLADIQHTARSVEHATELVLARAIDYLAGRPSGAETGTAKRISNVPSGAVRSARRRKRWRSCEQVNRAPHTAIVVQHARFRVAS